MPRRKTSQPVAPFPVDTPDSPLPAPLSPQWAFVVQLREGTSFNTTHIQGRVEHIISGKAALFHSLEELRAFMEQVLATQGGQRT
jgi:hypothetical protein